MRTDAMRGWLAAIIAVALFHSPVIAQEAPVAAPEVAPAPGGAPLETVQGLARQLDAALAGGNRQEAETLLAQMVDWKARLSADNLFFVSRILTARADMLAAAGNATQASIAAQYATTLSPDDYASWFVRARHAFAANRADFNAYGEYAYNGMRKWLEDPLNGKILAARALAMAVLGAAFAFMIFAGVVTLRQMGPIAHDIGRFLPFELEPRLAATAFVLLLLAVLCGAGVVAAIVFLALVLTGYAGAKGRIVLAVFLALVAALPFLIPPIGKGMALKNSLEARAAANFMRGGWEPEEIPTLEETAKRFPDDTALMVILGSYFRKTQRYDSAQRYLQQAYARDDRDVRTIMEIANLHFGKGEFREAELGYKNALSLSPSLFEGHFNLSRAYLEQFRTEEAEQELDAASRLNREKTNMLLAATKAAVNNAAKVASLPPARALPKFVASAVERDGGRIAQKIWTFYLPYVGMNTYLMAATGYMALFALAIALWGKAGAHSICTSCGAVFLPLFMKKEKGGVKCDRCVALSSAKKSTVLGPHDRIRMGIREYQARQRKVANLLNMALPGAGSAWFGAHIAGGLLLLFTGLFVAWAFNGLFLVAAGYRPAPVTAFALWGVALAFFYLLTVPFTMRRD
ncbi:MAG: hypothetical protein HZA04_07825 [Nitrospinae bacterium]|nr:hypothetical protein [Nitrospinota bacterium]